MLPELATKFVFDLLANNEEIKKFPNDFVTASAKWVRSWFLIDDPEPTAAATTAAPAEPAAIKAKVEARMQELQHNPDFQAQLTDHVEKYTALFDAERKGKIERLERLIKQLNAYQKDYDLESSAGRRVALEETIAEKKADIQQIKKELFG